jgi:NAD(P)-dependent dehydrogenase (short-subunit alcohol dehydrogenase family)
MQRFDLTGRRALVTGGSRGLGAAMARGLAIAGAEVVISAREPEGLVEEITAMRAQQDDASRRMRAITADVSVPGEPSRLVAESEGALGGPVDILIHAGGNLPRATALEHTEEQWRSAMDVHVDGAFRLCTAVGRRLIAEGRPGSIILVGSLTSDRAGVPGTLAYGVAKSGILGMMRTLAVEWGPRGIRVNCISPGFFPTALTRDIADSPARRAMHARIPLGRVGDPDDLAGAAVFLASDAAGYVSGVNLTVDGGWSVA